MRINDPTDQQSGLFLWGFIMTKGQALDLLMLLSGLESWSHSAKVDLPIYLSNQLDHTVEMLRNHVIGGDE